MNFLKKHEYEISILALSLRKSGMCQKTRLFITTTILITRLRVDDIQNLFIRSQGLASKGVGGLGVSISRIGVGWVWARNSFSSIKNAESPFHAFEDTDSIFKLEKN